VRACARLRAHVNAVASRVRSWTLAPLAWGVLEKFGSRMRD
jgi:hypothetical protein